MASAVKTLTFASRWDNIPLWGIVLLYTSEGTIRAEYANASEREVSGGNWAYDFLIHEEDLPGALTLDDVDDNAIIAPFVEEMVPCAAAPSSCFSDLPLVEGDDIGDEILVPVFDQTCGVWCLARAPRPPQYEPGGTFSYEPPEA